MLVNKSIRGYIPYYEEDKKKTFMHLYGNTINFHYITLSQLINLSMYLIFKMKHMYFEAIIVIVLGLVLSQKKKNLTRT